MADSTGVEELVADIHRRIEGDELTRLAEASRVSRAMETDAVALVDAFVRDARGAGRTWAEVAAVLGISKQAAQQRNFRRALHTVRASVARQARSGVPFGKAALRITTSADQQARALGRDYVGSEHLFLALLADPEGRSVLAGAGLPVQPVKEHLEGLAKGKPGPGDGVRSPTPRLERVMDLASKWAQATGVSEVGVTELLLAVLDSREASGMVETALVRKGGTSSMLLATAVNVRVFHSSHPRRGGR